MSVKQLLLLKELFQGESWEEMTETQDQAYQAGAPSIASSFSSDYLKFYTITSTIFFLTAENYKKQNMSLHKSLNGAVHFWQHQNIPHFATKFIITTIS